MLKLAIPVVHVTDSLAAEAFYCEKLGFQKRFAYRPDQQSADPCYMGVVRDDAWLHLSSFSGDSVAGIAVYLVVDDVDDLQMEFTSRGVEIALAPTDQTWGNREMYLHDPDGNSLRFVQQKDA